MNGKKLTQVNLLGGARFNREIKILVLFLSLISFSNLIFSNNTFALFTPTLSASVDQANLQINGNQVINSTNKTTEIPFNFTVNTNNRTGYTVTLSSETENTALTNATSTAGAKINSTFSAGPLGDFSNNTWGYKFGASSNYAPIPALSTPAQILQTTGKTNGNESNQLSIGMKLTDNLESGNYTNKLILSFVSNPYTPIAIMTEGPDFNTKLKALETATNRIEHFKKSPVAPPATFVDVVNIEDEESDCEIKLWLDPTDKTAYYYAEPGKVYLNADSSRMFFLKWDNKDLLEIDVSNFDTSKVTDMSRMFYDLRNITSLGLSNFDTSKVTTMNRMFSGMSNLTSLDLSNFDTSKVTTMGSMFYLDEIPKDKLKTIYVNNDFDTANLTDTYLMFANRKKLRGGNGSYLADPLTADKTWLRIDDPAHGRPGYFTRKP